MVLVGFAFGLRKNSPGKSNEKMAEIILENNQGEPVIVQGEIAEAFPGEGDFPLRVIPGNKSEGESYTDTHEVAKRSLEIMERQDWQGPITVVCHKAHEPRIRGVFNKLLPQRGSPERLVRFLKQIQEVPYDFWSLFKGGQWWTTNPILWWIREIPARLVYKWKGYI